MKISSERVVRILGVGSAPGDGVMRVSKGQDFACFLGTEAEHETLRSFCEDLESLLASMELSLDQLGPEELWALIVSHGLHEGRECAS